MHTNKKLGLSKDTPFATKYTEYNHLTRAIFNVGGSEKCLKPCSSLEMQKQLVSQTKIFDKMCNAGSSVEN